MSGTLTTQGYLDIQAELRGQENTSIACLINCMSFTYLLHDGPNWVTSLMNLRYDNVSMVPAKLTICDVDVLLILGNLSVNLTHEINSHHDRSNAYACPLSSSCFPRALSHHSSQSRTFRPSLASSAAKTMAWLRRTSSRVHPMNSSCARGASQP